MPERTCGECVGVRLPTTARMLFDEGWTIRRNPEDYEGEPVAPESPAVWRKCRRRSRVVVSLAAPACEYFKERDDA